MYSLSAQRAPSLSFTIAQYKAVWPSILSDCKRSENPAGERAAAQDVTMESTEEGVKSAVVTRSRMKDKTMARCLLGVLGIRGNMDWELPGGNTGVEIA